ncbi:MAG: AraC family transcriptional regulator, partial [Clostridia bacterium]|nr:AraC family transcriptional regulator [Clostridia bacterium]
MFFSGNLLSDSDLGFAIQKLTYFERATMPELHYHDHYEILYVTKNERFLTVNGNRYTLNDSSIALIPPYIPHLTEAGEKIPQERVLINFREDFIHKIRSALNTDILSCFNPAAPIIIIDSSADKINLLINQLLELSQSTSRNNDELLLLCLCNFLMHLCEFSVEYTNYSSFFEVIKFTERNFGEKITLDMLSQKFYMSKYTILRKFKEYTGMGLPEYLNTIRVINAKKQLADSEKIINVALSCGFGSVPNF